jgi:hypothetical protein
MREAHVSDDVFVKERRRPAFGAVEKLIGNDEVQRFQLLLQRADGAKRKQPFDAKLLEAVNVGAKGKIRGADAVSASVAG